MNDKTKLVYNGFTKLDLTDQKEFIEAIQAWSREDYSLKEKRRKELNEAVRKVISGPLGETCPCCGR